MTDWLNLLERVLHGRDELGMAVLVYGGILVKYGIRVYDLVLFSAKGPLNAWWFDIDFLF